MWRETTREIWFSIYYLYKNELEVFGSYTDLTGDDRYTSDGFPFIMTEYRFKEAKNPLIRVEKTKKNMVGGKWNSKYFLYSE